MLAYLATSRGDTDSTMRWTAELQVSGLGRLALARFGVIVPEDVGVASPHIPALYEAARKQILDLWRKSEDEQQSHSAHRAAVLLLHLAHTLADAPKCRMVSAQNCLWDTCRCN